MLWGATLNINTRKLHRAPLSVKGYSFISRKQCKFTNFYDYRWSLLFNCHLDFRLKPESVCSCPDGYWKLASDPVYSQFSPKIQKQSFLYRNYGLKSTVFVTQLIVGGVSLKDYIKAYNEVWFWGMLSYLSVVLPLLIQSQLQIHSDSFAKM